VEATIAIGPQATVGHLVKLSVNGGVIRLPRPAVSGAFADLRMNTVSGAVGAAIEFLADAPGCPGAQAFRFITLDPEDRRRLQSVIAQMVKEGFGEARQSTLGGVAVRLQSIVGKTRDALLARNLL
jgi:hypothetical protein